MATHDIEGAQPGSRRSRKLSGAGNAIVDNRGMAAAGVKLNANSRHGGGHSNVFGLNANEYDAAYQRERNPLGTHDINGGQKRNRFGQKLEVEERLVGKSAGVARRDIDAAYQKQGLSNNMAICVTGGKMMETGRKDDSENLAPVVIAAP